MGAGVSSWNLARAVASLGQLGVVSGTALDVILARRLQTGDQGGHMRRAMQQFPFPEIAQQVLDQYFVAGGKPPEQAFKALPLYTIQPPQSLTALTVIANFVEVFLAKEGHDGLVGINYLEKIQMPTLPSLFGAMLAGVDYVLMGAGIPRSIPGILDDLTEGKPVKLRLDVANSPAGEEFACVFDPQTFCQGRMPALRRPYFLAIVSSATLAMTLARKSTGRVDGFIVEGPTAGGHNAPPRGPMQLNETGEPLYGVRDLPDLDKIKALGLPFWLAGSFATPERLTEARQLGAAGVQVGTAFAFCEESGIDPELKRRVIQKAREGTTKVFTDPVASPTGFPFKVMQMEDTISDPLVYAARERVCDLGYLRQPYWREDGTIGYCCPGEPVESYLRKGGSLAETVGRKCVCNVLMSTIGLGQVLPDQQVEKPMLTTGDDIANIGRFLKEGRDSYSASDVILYLSA